MTTYTVNASILLTELPITQRPRAVAEAGFKAVEFWWPFPVAVPSDADVEGFVSAVRDAGVQLSGLNLFAGDMAGGDRGLVSWVGRESEFADNVDVVVGIGERLGCRAFNALYGLRADGGSEAEADELGVANLRLAAEKIGQIGGTVLLEPVSHAADFGHVQIADDPGRGQPGTGNLPLDDWLDAARAGGYDGYVGLEYKDSSTDPFAWLPRDQRT
jgi:hydroxypyruvate isomerase